MHMHMCNMCMRVRTDHKRIVALLPLTRKSSPPAAQVTTNIQEVYSIEMPAQTQLFLDSLKGVVSFDVTKLFGVPLECARLSGYTRKLAFMMVWPIVVCGGIIFGQIGNQLLRFVHRNRPYLNPLPEENPAATMKRWLGLGLGAATQRGLRMSLPAVSIITFMAFPSVSSVAFRAWACVEFDMDTKYDIYNKPLQRAAPHVESFMRDDLKIKCSSPLAPR